MGIQRSSRFARARPGLAIRVLRAVWLVVRILLVAGGVMGPAPPPPPLPKPPPIEVSAKSGEQTKRR